MFLFQAAADAMNHEPPHMVDFDGVCDGHLITNKPHGRTGPCAQIITAALTKHQCNAYSCYHTPPYNFFTEAPLLLLSFSFFIPSDPPITIHSLLCKAGISAPLATSKTRF
jgi:hypothetical protein